MRRVLFIDRAGGLTLPPGDAAHGSWDLRLLPGVIPALRRARAAGYEIVVLNDREASGAAAWSAAADEFLASLFDSQGVPFTTLSCPHEPGDDCACHKPGLGLVRDYVNAAALDRQRSAVVGASDADLEFARNLGVAGLKLGAPGTENWEAIVHQVLDRPRSASVRRRTRETDIRVTVDLDTEAEPRATTGLGFFDHMLEQLGKHGGFKLEVACSGDLHIDEHHTIEDVALALGQALREALGDKRGIQRYGFLLPMDEADAEVSIDLGGRPYAVFEGRFPREQVGGLPTELVPHFFRSLAETLGAAIHVRVRGENTHHMIEVTFKAVARALRQAIKREGDVLPSTKGQL
jgi:imidazoleglycerol-phosphate dehydratase/histidinol-phosphatase